MKELFEILTNEDKSFEGLPKWVYIFAIPAALVLACMIGGTFSWDYFVTFYKTSESYEEY